MYMLHCLFYLETSLHVPGGNITHLQEHKTTVIAASGNVTPYCCLLLSWKSWNGFKSVVGGVLTYIHTYLLTYLLTYLHPYLRTYLFHGAESFLRS